MNANAIKKKSHVKATKELMVAINKFYNDGIVSCAICQCIFKHEICQCHRKRDMLKHQKNSWLKLTNSTMMV